MAEVLIGGLVAAGQKDMEPTQPTHEAADNSKAISPTRSDFPGHFTIPLPIC